jgi:predicted outer membrane repeat protein
MWRRYSGIIVMGGLLACLLGAPPVQAATWCVGSATDLTAALSAAESNGEDDLIQVVQGTYNGNFVYFTNEAYSLTIKGGYTVDCASRVVDPANTVLDGQGAATVLALESTGLAVAMSVDGVTLQHGANSDGGGLYVRPSAGDVTLTNIVIGNNTATYRGGGVYVGLAATVLIDHAILSDNTAGTSGGGLYVDGAVTVTLTNTTVSGNTAARDGGGSMLNVATTFTIDNTIFGNNGASDGGGLYVWKVTALTLTNTTVTANAAINGGGLWVQLHGNSDQANIYNNIFWANDAILGAGADVYLNNDGNGDFVPSAVNLFHNDFDYNTLYMTLPMPIDASNLDAQDPLFVDATQGDYHLQGGSPVIDMGDNAAPALPTTDLDGNPRIMRGVVDMGAYEYQRSEPCDANSDGRIDRRDAWELLRYLWKDGEPLLGDADCHQDGEINFRDVLAILKASR